MTPKIRSVIFLNLLITSIAACNASSRGIFAERTAREKYEDKIEKTESPEVIAWKRHGEQVLHNPLIVSAPYSEKGNFVADSTDANAFLVRVAPGQKIVATYQKESMESPIAFMELWDGGNPTQPSLVKAADTTQQVIEHPAPYGGNFIVRLQPKLDAKGSYQLHIAVAPILGFPVASHIKSNIGSFWGADRDAGVRKHEGIDIFAKKGSSVVAVSNGTIRRVSEGGIGGKVIWFHPDDEDFSVYYAHLDTQYVVTGQRVTKGQPLGTVGNTGNAKYTPAHLHFGIYTGFGAVDPLAFVQTVKESPAIVTKKLNESYKPTSKLKLYPSPKKQNPSTIARNVTIKTVSATHQFYRVLLSDGTRGFVAMSELHDNLKL